TFKTAVSYPVGGSPSSLIAADLNSDGKPDLVTTVTGDFSNFDASVLLNQGGGFQPAVSYALGTNTRSLIAADWNGDGKPDLEAVNSGASFGHETIPGSVSVLLNQGDGTFQSAANYIVGDKPFSLVVADLNGDGKPDLATADNTSQSVSVLLNQG